MNNNTKRRKNKVGIYKITNIRNGKCYIGQSVHLVQRLGDHKRHLRKGIHINSHLQRAYDKYGKDAFVFEIIEECDPDQLDDRESFWIELFDSTNRDNGYNFQTGGNERATVHEETKAKMRVIQRGKNNKLNKSEVEEIKRLLLRDVSQVELSERYNVSVSTIYRIYNLDNWSWVAPELNEALKQHPIKKQKQFEERVKKLANMGWSHNDISRHLNCTPKRINNIVKSTYYEDYAYIAEKVKEEYKNNVPVEETLKRYNISRSTYSNHTRELRHERKQKLHEEIIRLKKSGMLNKDIAKKLGVHRTTVTEHLKGRVSGERKKPIKYSEKLGAEIIQLLQEGLSQREVSRRLEISRDLIKKAIKINQKEIS